MNIKNQKRALIVGKTIQEVTLKSFDLKNLGFIRECRIQRSEATGEYFQWWTRPKVRPAWLINAVHFLREREAFIR